MKKKLIVSILSLSMVFGFMLGGSSEVFAAISGAPGESAVNPIMINSAEDLVAMQQSISADNPKFGDAYYKLAGDIDMKGIDFTTIGSADDKKFAGDFNGNDKKITNLTVNPKDPLHAADQGLFGYVGGNAKIYNLNIVGCSVTGSGNVGAVVGSLNDNAKISGCSATGNITANGADGFVGGLVGMMAADGGFIAQSSSSCAVSADKEGAFIGGLVGVVKSAKAEVRNCYSTGVLLGSANSTIGGLIGKMEHGKLLHSYFNGTATVAKVGYIVGTLNGGEVKHCYFKSTNSADKEFSGTAAQGSTVEKVGAKAPADFQSGEVCYLLQTGNGENVALIWGQNITGKTPATVPSLTANEKNRVCKVEIVDKVDSKNGSENFLNKGQKLTIASKDSKEAKLFTDEAMKTEFDYKTKTIDNEYNRFYVSWAATTFTVTFNTNGGSAVADITGVVSGSKITKPTDPTKKGYTFGGWYTDNKFATAWEFDKSTVTGNTTLYAKWNAETGAAVATSANNNPKAGDEGIPIAYFIIFGIAFIGVGTAAGVLIWRKKQGY
ncbi:MAG: InlB B-repeat-containing protein [Clostridiales bacterium]